MHSFYQPLSTSYLRVDDSYALVHATIALAENYSASLCPWLQQAVQAMHTHNQVLGAHLKDARRQQHTLQLQALHKQRATLWTSVRRRVRYYMLEGNAQELPHARTLHLLLQPYAQLARQALPTQTALIAELMARYKQDHSLLVAVKALGMTVLVSTLQRANTEFDTLYRQRNQVVASRTGTNSQLRAQSMGAYKAFCRLLQQVCCYAEDKSDLLLLVAQMNELRAKYHLLAKPRKHYKHSAHSLAPIAPPITTDREQPTSLSVHTAVAEHVPTMPDILPEPLPAPKVAQHTTPEGVRPEPMRTAPAHAPAAQHWRRVLQPYTQARSVVRGGACASGGGVGHGMSEGVSGH